MENNRIKSTPGERVFDAANVVFLVIFSLIMLFPMWHAVCVSFSEGHETMKGGLFLWPRNFDVTAYRMVIAEPNFLRSYENTILYTAAHTFLVLFISSVTAYPMAVSGFCLKRFTTVMLAIPMFIGGGMIPTYLLMKALGLLDTFTVMVLPGCVSCYNVVLFRTFFQGNAISLREAAMIDGANEMNIYARLVVPLSKPIFATLGLFTAVGKWNGWYDALIYLNDSARYPVQMILRRILFNVTAMMENVDQETAQMFTEYSVTAQNIQMAAVVFVAVPILMIYPFCQKYFVKGAFVGSLKG